jgi:transcriptional regulator with PAS, ATPase and Fis domain
VANLNASVLVTGESGTGKELIARAIHNLGSRAGRPFVAVCCGAIPETLIESELFGHEKGAFTGTVGMREGYLEQAGEGTLLLDEIGELSHATQVKLLRVLQRHGVCRLSVPSHSTAPDLATHTDWPNLAQGKFKLDIFYRMNVRSDGTVALERVKISPNCYAFPEAIFGDLSKTVEEIRPGAIALLQLPRRQYYQVENDSAGHRRRF